MKPTENAKFTMEEVYRLPQLLEELTRNRNSGRRRPEQGNIAFLKGICHSHQFSFNYKCNREIDPTAGKTGEKKRPITPEKEEQNVGEEELSPPNKRQRIPVQKESVGKKNEQKDPSPRVESLKKIPKPILEIDGNIDPSEFNSSVLKITCRTNIDLEGLKNFQKCPALKILNLSGALYSFRTRERQNEALKALSACVKNFRLRDLNLSRNPIGEALLQIIPVLKEVEILNISDIGLEGETAEEFFGYLNPSLRQLNLSLNNIGGSVKNLHRFTTLEILDISSSRIPSDDLDTFLTQMSFTQLKELNLSDNGSIGDLQDGWLAFCNTLIFLKNLSSLRVGDIGLSKIQVEELLTVILKNPLHLHCLDLSYCDFDNSLVSLFIAACQNLPALKKIYLDGIPFFPEVDAYLKKRVISVEWEIEDINEQENE